MYGRIKSRVCLLFIKWFILNFTYFQFMIHSNVQKVKFFSIPTKTDETMKKFWYGGCRTCRTRCVVPVFLEFVDNVPARCNKRTLEFII